MADQSSSLFRLAALAGVIATYRDAWGKERRVADDAVRAALGAMGIAVDTQGAIEDGVASLEAEAWRPLLPPVVVLHQDRPASVTISLPERLDAGRILWSVTGEEARAEGTADPTALAVAAVTGEGAQRHRRLVLPLEKLPLGYHRLSIAAGTETAETDLIVVPRHGYMPPALSDRRQCWGLTAQLYTVRSARNWGMGDYADLGEIAALAAARGASVVGINPLHALFPAEPRHLSPYSPSTRLFLNPLYLDATAVPEFAASVEAQALVASAEFRAILAGARAADEVDHPAIARLKRPLFALLHRDFAARHLAPGGAATSERGAAFRRFQRDGGAMLEGFGRFNALHARMLAEGKFSWRDWPAELRDARSGAVGAFAAAHADEVELHHYLEWEGDRQLAAAAARGRAAGLDIGLYRDLAIGVDPCGARAWADPALLADRASVGAPPDLVNLKGQDWGLAPINPMMLRRRAYAPFIAALRANMRHAGMLRIDHAMGLKQLYWVPRGAGPAHGAYVAYPFDDMLGILALESMRNRCAVIGEDLGTVPPGFSRTLNDAAVLSYRVLLFERDEGTGEFVPPRAYERQAAAAFSTHDLPTLRGFWLGTDLAWRLRLGLYPSALAGDEDVRRRRVDRRLLLDALLAEGVIAPATARRLLPADDAPVFATELAEAVHRFLGRTNAALTLVQIEDALGEGEQPNLPGTVHEHPNWRRKLSCALEDWPRDASFAAVIAALDRARKERAR